MEHALHGDKEKSLLKCPWEQTNFITENLPDEGIFSKPGLWFPRCLDSNAIKASFLMIIYG